MVLRVTWHRIVVVKTSQTVTREEGQDNEWLVLGASRCNCTAPPVPLEKTAHETIRAYQGSLDTPHKNTRSLAWARR